ncbi:BrnT family toxin [Candidatus Microgenomates bacterium]|nr:BrnT family toxin [Candidatus Microgenomates bacterium]
MRVVKKPVEFDWDKVNIGKNLSHEVEDKESEEAFLDENKVIFKDRLHSIVEERFVLLGKTNKNRLLYVIYTMREKKVRIISARDINKKEVRLYEEAT